MKKKYIIFILIVVVFTIALAAIITVCDPDNMIMGNNANAFGYGRGGIHEKNFKSLDEVLREAMKAEKVEKDYNTMTLLYEAQTGNLVKVFMLYKDQVRGYEFLVNESGNYNYIGVRSATFANFFETKEYDWKTTVLSDLSSSTKKAYRRIVRPKESYGVLPAWGVFDTDQVKNMTVDGQKVDEIIEFSKEEENYYLWIIDDLQTENNAKDIKIDWKG